MERAPVARITCLCTDGLEYRLHTPPYCSNEDSPPMRRLPSEGEINVRYGVDVYRAPVWATIAPAEDGNGVCLEVYDRPRKEFAPHGIYDDLRYTWKRMMGAHPLLQAEEEFGFPPFIKVRFLGHPDRLALIPLMSRQNKEYIPERQATLPAEKGLARLVVFSSPVFGCDDFHDGPYLRDVVPLNRSRRGSLLTDHNAPGFWGEGMIFAEIFSGGESVLGWRLGVTTVAGEDSLLRVRRSEPTIFDARAGDCSPVAYRLAQVSLVTRALAGRIGDYWPGVVSADGEFPLQVIDYFHQYITDAVRPPWESQFGEVGGQRLKECFRLDWDRLSGRFSPNEVEREENRILRLFDKTLAAQSVA